MILRLVGSENDYDREIEAVIAASIARYVKGCGERPAGAILVLLTEDGGNAVTYCRATRADFALAGARLLQKAVDD